MLNPVNALIFRYRKHYYTTIFERAYRQVSEEHQNEIMFRDAKIFNICKKDEQAYMIILVNSGMCPFTIYYRIENVYRDNQVNVMSVLNAKNGMLVLSTVSQPKDYNKQKQIDVVVEGLKMAFEGIKDNKFK